MDRNGGRGKKATPRAAGAAGPARADDIELQLTHISLALMILGIRARSFLPKAGTHVVCAVRGLSHRSAFQVFT